MALSCDAGDASDPGQGRADGAVSVGDVPADMQSVLDLHNQERVSLGVAPLAWHAGLAGSAQGWVDGCVVEHDPDRRYEGALYGENIAAGSSSFGAGGLADAWLGERSAYDCASNECDGLCGHYTQLIWADSTELGCAVADCGSNLVLSCRYLSAGNVVGARAIPASNCP